MGDRGGPGYRFKDEFHPERFYQIMANYIFYLDALETQDEEDLRKLLGLFLVKFLHEQGLFPNIEKGLFSEEDLSHVRNLSFHLQEGTFFEAEDSSSHHETAARELYLFLRSSVSCRFQDFSDCSHLGKSSLKLLSDYCLLHLKK